MGGRVRKALHASAAAGIVATAAPALAQAGATPPSESDIIVTARRVEERLQDVPISITVFNQQQLNDRNITSAADLGNYTPSLTVSSRYGADNTTFAVRGFSQDGRTTASVGTYFADVVAPRGGTTSISTGDGAGPGAFFDLQNVQVLKGPQGTLFGRNTTGGAVLLVPQKPTGRLEGYVEGSYGNYDLRRIQAVVNVPLLDNARLRLGIDRQKRDGYLRNIGVGPGRLADSDYVALRGSLVVDLTPDLENYTIVSYSRSDTRGSIPKAVACNPNPPTPTAVSVLRTFGTLACQSIARQQGRGFYTVEGSIPDPQSYLEQWQVINTTTWKASDTLTIKNIASYSQLKNKIRADFFGATYILPTTIVGLTGATVPTGRFAGSVLQFNNIYAQPGRPNAYQANFTEELQLQGSGLGDRLRYQLGGYVELSDPLGELGAAASSRLVCADRVALQCVDVIGQLIGAPGNLTLQRYRSSYHDFGLYGQATYSLTDKLKLTGGIRYTWDTTRSTASNVAFAFYPVLTGLGRCPNTALPGVLTLRFTSLDAAFARCRDRQVQKSDAPTWLAGIDYSPIEDVLVYAKYARGYRQGSTNPLGQGITTFEPEKVDTYEGGVKASWRGPLPGFMNVAGFYNDFRNQQLTQTLLDLPTNASPPGAAIVNVGKSRIYGVEVEAGITLFRSLRIDGSYAYLNSKLLSASAPNLAGTPYNTAQPLTVGRALPLTPRNKYSITGTYTLPLDERIGRVSVGATYSYIGGQIVTPTPFGSLDSYHVLSLNLNWRSIAGSPIDLQLFATNVTQEHYYTISADNYTSLGVASFNLGEPRIYGARLRYRFGG